jgi:hypothetical protein
MTDEAVAAYIHDLRVLNYNASQGRMARSFGRTERLLEAAWAEQDRRRKGTQAFAVLNGTVGVDHRCPECGLLLVGWTSAFGETAPRCRYCGVDMKEAV